MTQAMNRRLSLHSNFFSSLKQVEKRLKLDNASTPPQQPPQEDHNNLTESLSSPLCLYVDQNHTFVGNNQSLKLENSETPVEFLSNSVAFPQIHENPVPESPQIDAETLDRAENSVDEIGLLIELLGLSDFEGGFLENSVEEGKNTCSSCHCVGGFFDKVVGLKGPKCGIEKERLDGWIKYFWKEKIDPFRLAHLLLGKATCMVTDGDDNGNGSLFEGIQFPSTVEEYLQRDPPITSIKEG